MTNYVRYFLWYILGVIRQIENGSYIFDMLYCCYSFVSLWLGLLKFNYRNVHHGLMKTEIYLIKKIIFSKKMMFQNQNIITQKISAVGLVLQ